MTSTTTTKFKQPKHKLDLIVFVFNRMSCSIVDLSLERHTHTKPTKCRQLKQKPPKMHNIGKVICPRDYLIGNNELN